MSNKKGRNSDDERRVRRLDSEDKTKLDKYKHLIYDDTLYEDDDFYDEFHTTKIQKTHRTYD